MVRNTDGLKRSARSRSEDAMQRATGAILLMQSEEAEINFRSVATRAKVSTAWLYGTKSLRDKLMKIRTTSPAGAGENLQQRQRLSHERVVATLRLRIRTLEEINRELKEQLEAVYGRLAVVQTKLGSCTERQNECVNHLRSMLRGISGYVVAANPTFRETERKVRRGKGFQSSGAGAGPPTKLRACS